MIDRRDLKKAAWRKTVEASLQIRPVSEDNGYGITSRTIEMGLVLQRYYKIS